MIIFTFFCAFGFAWFLMFVFSFLHLRFVKNIKPVKSELRKFKRGSIFKRLFFDFPKQFIHDKLTIDPNTFQEYGLHLVCGEQGSGKTTTCAYLARRMKYIYPKLRVVTNFNCSIQDDSLDTWQKLTLDTNGIYGELDIIDEIQNWFSSGASRNFPPDMLTIVTQQRKVRRCILATSQVFTRIGKPLRENTYLMYYPFTVAGCLTFVRVYRPQLDSEGNLVSKQLKKVFFFVHDEELRNMFDSYKTICNLSKSGFVDSDKVKI